MNNASLGWRTDSDLEKLEEEEETDVEKGECKLKVGVELGASNCYMGLFYNFMKIIFEALVRLVDE